MKKETAVEKPDFKSRMKEFFRKKIVGLKRSPQMISLILIMICCCIFTFSLSDYSSASLGLYQDSFIEAINAALASQGITQTFAVPGIYRNPAMYMFVQTLFSYLLVISFLSSYKGGKRNNFMWSISLAMVVIMIVCDIVYYLALNYYTNIDTVLIAMGWTKTTQSFNIDLTAQRSKAMLMSIIHLVALVISLASILAIPLLKKLLAKIDTSVQDEYDDLMEQKSDEELMIELEDEN